MTTLMTNAPVPTERHHLSLQVRAADLDTDSREFVGIAVPWDTEIELWPGVREKFTRGSIEPREGVKLFWRHGDVIGLVVEHTDTPEGWQIRGRISRTPLGDEAYTLLRDGVIDRLSIGFEPVEWDYDQHRELTTHTRARVHEVSLVPIPAYEDARITQVRAAANSTTPNPTSTTTEGDTPVTTTAPESTALTETEVRSMLTETERRLAVQISEARESAPPAVETRSAGQLIKDALSGDQSAVDALNAGQAAAFDTRSYVGRVATMPEQRDSGTAPVTSAAGGTAQKPGYVGDLTRLVEQAAGVRALFAEGALPSEGKHIEYGQLDVDASDVDEQTNEGDDLTYGEVSVTTDTAPVLTFGGWTQLTRQAIERSTAPVLDVNLRGQALAAGRYLNAAFRAHYASAVTAQRTAGNTVDVPDTDPTWADWLDAIVDAAEKYEDMGLSLDGLIVDKAAFKAFNRYEGSDGRPLFTYTGQGSNVIGSLDVTALRGSIANLPVYLNAKQTTPGQVFFNSDAIRTYRSPLVRLQDTNVINLTEAFSLYGYVAFADEIPAGLVPVKRTTAA